jgi:hypothetical protein
VSENCLWLPNIANFAAVDSVAVHNGAVYVFQCSKYANHGYNYNGIMAVWNNLKHVREHIKGVYLVVPSTDVYDKVKWQKLEGEVDGKTQALSTNATAASGIVDGTVVDVVITDQVDESNWPIGLLQWKLLSPIGSITPPIRERKAKRRGGSTNVRRRK